MRAIERLRVLRVNAHRFTHRSLMQLIGDHEAKCVREVAGVKVWRNSRLSPAPALRRFHGRIARP